MAAEGGSGVVSEQVTPPRWAVVPLSCSCWRLPGRELLSQDLYLQSQMDNDQYLSVRSLASLDQIRSISTDLELISQVLTSWCPSPQVLEMWQT